MKAMKATKKVVTISLPKKAKTSKPNKINAKTTKKITTTSTTTTPSPGPTSQILYCLDGSTSIGGKRDLPIGVYII